MEGKIVQVGSGLFKYQRNSFWEAAMTPHDSAVGSETFDNLENVMPVENGVLKIRYGTKKWNQSDYNVNYFTNLFNHRYNNTAYVAAARSNGLSGFWNESGTNVGGNYTTTAEPRCVSRNGVLYFSTGAFEESKKVTGTDVTSNSNWGIKKASLSYSHFQTTVLEMVSLSLVASGSASVAVPLAAVPPEMVMQGLAISFKYDRGAGTTNTPFTVSLLVNGVEGPTTYSFTATNVTQTATISGAGDVFVFGITCTPSDILNGQVKLKVTSNPMPGGGAVNLTQIRLDANGIMPIQFTTAAGAVTLVSGRKYVACLRNSATGHTSDLVQAFSASTGPLTSQNIALSGIPYGSDSQVDRVWVLATADGGDEQTLYLLADLPNGTTTLTDNVKEADLLLQPIVQSVDEFGNESGVIGNVRAPFGTYPTLHQDRVFMVVDNQLRYAKNLAEVTTVNGLITAVPEECWPEDNLIDLSLSSETVKGMLSLGDNLFVATDKYIYQIAGTTGNYQPPIRLFPVGIAAQDGWQIIFKDGAPSGVMWLTPDLKIVGSDMSSFYDVGKPVQPILATLNRSQLSLIKSAYLSDATYDLFVIAFPTGSNTYADTVLVYNIQRKAWFRWSIFNLITALLPFRKSDGSNVWLFGGVGLIPTGGGISSGGQIYAFDKTKNVDNYGTTAYDTSTQETFTVNVETQLYDFGDPIARKVVNEVELDAPGWAAATMSMYGMAPNADRLSGYALIKSGSLSQGVFGEAKFYPAGTATNAKYNRLLKFKYSVPSTAANIVMNNFAVEFVPVHRL